MLGESGCGEVYKAFDTHTRQVVAVKLESQFSAHPQLQFESAVYDILQNSSAQVAGFPKVLFYGEVEMDNVLVMQCLGRSLEDLLCVRRKLSLKFVLNIGLQALKRIKYLHHKSLIHRDIKPENLMIGRRDSKRVYLVDFGLAANYRDPVTKEHVLEHVPYCEENSPTGTPAFISVNTHRGERQSRRDDLISLGYVLVYLYKGSLPWEPEDGTRTDSVHSESFCSMEVMNDIYFSKQGTSPYQLCDGMPSEMLEYFLYAHNLKFTDRPHYGFLKDLFVQALQGLPSKGFWRWRCWGR